MKLVGELKSKVEKTENIEDAKEIIKNAGMELTDEEMDKVAGGRGTTDINGNEHWGEAYSIFQGFR